MAPLEERYENDSTFQSLLVSQRELLSKLNYEKQLEQEQQKMNERASAATAPSNLSIGFQSFRCDNVVFSKRFSIGVGNDNFILPDSSFDSDPYTPSSFYPIDGGKKRPKDGSNDDAIENKRRRTTLSFLDYLFDKNEDSDKRRKKTEKTRVEYNDSDDEDYGVVIEDASDSDESDNDDDFENVSSRPRIDPTEAKDKMVSFEGAMGKSQDSQQAIHDWDRKMGLKRSHSKTMRLSSRSRKKLRTLMQKDIDHLKSCLS